MSAPSLQRLLLALKARGVGFRVGDVLVEPFGLAIDDVLAEERAAIAAWLKRAAPSAAGLVDIVHLAEVIEEGGYRE